MTGKVAQDSIRKRLGDAIGSIRGSNENPTGKAFIRLDYRQGELTSLTSNEIYRYVNGRMVIPDSKGIRGIDVVEFIEFLYKDTAGQAQKIVFQVQNGKLVILP